MKGIPSPGEVRQPEARQPASKSAWARLLENKPLSSLVGVFVALALIGVVWIMTGSRSRHQAKEAAARDGADAADAPHREARRGGQEADAPAARPQFKTIACKVYTHQPGFFVLVDGEIARDSNGK